MGPFCDSVAEAADAPVYRALARLGSRFIDAELTSRGIEAPEVRRPGPSAVEGDDVTCGGANGCPLTDLIGRPDATET